MDYHGYRRESFKENAGRYNHANRPRLPGFESFVQASGCPDLAYRGPPRYDNPFGSPLFSNPSLPTPPATNGGPSYWMCHGRQDGSQGQPVSMEDHESPQHEMHRRASLAFPSQARPQPRPARPYSSTNQVAECNEATNWPSGQVIQEENVPGKGPCYVYDDGTIIPKEINGDTVNPKWGTTKAGKPRKRLGQACSSCREKKIKCDPQNGFLKCSQCLRFNRDCRFDQNSRQGHRSQFRTSTTTNTTHQLNSPGATTASYSPKDRSSSRKSSVTPTESPPPTDVVHRTISKSLNSVDEVVLPTMSDRQGKGAPTPSKRQRLNDRSVGNANYDFSRHDSTTTAQHFGFAPHLDPISTNSKLANNYLNAFMEYGNVPTFEVFPRRQFMEWTASNKQKSLADKIMLYAILAFGSVHSEEPNRVAHRAAFKSIVYQELDQLETQCCLQMVHALHFMAFSEFADAQHMKGYSNFVRCVGMARFLQMNVEIPMQDTIYGMSPSMSAECRRRSYWAVSCTDTYSALSHGNPRLLNNVDVFLRLPCASHLYENDRIPQMPICDPENVLPKSLTTEDHLELGSMAYLIQIATICSEVQLNSWRCQNSLRIGQRRVHDKDTRSQLEARLKAWTDTYNDFIHAKEGIVADANEPYKNNDSRTRARKFAGLDVLCHYAHMELNRRIYHLDLTGHEIREHARKATIHAIEILKLTQQLLMRGGTDTRDYAFLTRGPLAGYAIHTAIDIVTAAGKLSDILQPQSQIMTLMYGALEFLGQLSGLWASAYLQCIQVKARIQTVFSSSQAAVYERKTFFYCTEGMLGMVDKDFDLIYGSDRKQYLRAAYGVSEAVKCAEVFEISVKGEDEASQSRTPSS